MGAVVVDGVAGPELGEDRGFPLQHGAEVDREAAVGGGDVGHGV
jgi:hypothetical protein